MNEIAPGVVEYGPAGYVQASSVSMRQAKLALLEAGKLASVEAAIEALQEPDRAKALIEWQSAATVDRSHPTVALIAAASGMTEAEIDGLFMAANAIV